MTERKYGDHTLAELDRRIGDLDGRTKIEVSALRALTGRIRELETEIAEHDECMRYTGNRVQGLDRHLLEVATAVQKECWEVGSGDATIMELNLPAIIASVAPTPPALTPEGPEFTDSARAALLWVLYHHQGGSSPVGQPIRFALGMGQHEHLTDEQIAAAKVWNELKAPQHDAAPKREGGE